MRKRQLSNEEIEKIKDISNKVITYVGYYINDVIDHQLQDIDNPRLYLEVETFLRRISIENMIPVRNQKNSTIQIKKLMKSIPFCLPENVRKMAKSMFKLVENNVFLDSKNSLFIYICSLIRYYINSYETNIVTDDSSLMICVRECLTNRRLKGSLVEYFGFSIRCDFKKYDIFSLCTYAWTCKWEPLPTFNCVGNNNTEKNKPIVYRLQELYKKLPYI
ncbi:hypothetical protein WA158_006967 [Blastocystis sp. Blastoise]